MGLYRMDTLLKQAGRQHIALGAFECWESMNIQGIAKAAANCKMPVIFQATPVEYEPMGGAEALSHIVRFYVKKYDIDVACNDIDNERNVNCSILVWWSAASWWTYEHR